MTGLAATAPGASCEFSFQARRGARRRARRRRPGRKRATTHGAIGHTPIQQTLFVKSVECGHDRGVSKRTLQLLNHVADVALASRPENLHEIKLQAAEGQLLGDLAGTRDAMLEKADHLRNKTTPQTPLSGQGHSTLFASSGKIPTLPPRRGPARQCSADFLPAPSKNATHENEGQHPVEHRDAPRAARVTARRWCESRGADRTTRPCG